MKQKLEWDIFRPLEKSTRAHGAEAEGDPVEAGDGHLRDKGGGRGDFEH